MSSNNNRPILFKFSATESFFSEMESFLGIVRDLVMGRGLGLGSYETIRFFESLCLLLQVLCLYMIVVGVLGYSADRMCLSIESIVGLRLRYLALWVINSSTWE